MELECVKSIPVSDSECLNSCEGLFITGFDRREFDQEQVDGIMSKVSGEYEFYKSGANFTDSEKFGGDPSFSII